MNRKVIYILGGLLVLILIIAGIIIYKKSVANKPAATNQTQQSGDNSTTGQNTDTGQTAPKVLISKISDTPAISPTLSFTDNGVWFFTSDGHLYTVNLSSGLKQEYLLPSNLSVSNVIWPRSGNNFIIVTETALAGKTFNFYDAANKTYTQYSKNIAGVDFTPDAKNVVYNWVADNGSSSLSIANPDGSGHQTIMDLPDGSYDVKVSPKGGFAFLSDYKNPSNGKLLFIDLSKKTSVAFKTGSSNAVQWAPDGVAFAFNKPTNNPGSGTDLWISHTDSIANDKDTGIAATAGQVAFDSTGNYIYITSAGSIYKVNTSTLDKTKVLDSDSNVTINPSQMIVSTDGTSVFFVNSDGYLYRGTLAQ